MVRLYARVFHLVGLFVVYRGDAVNIHPLHRYPSTYLALVTWGAAGFMSAPTFAAFLVHFAVVPLSLASMLWLAHWEGRHEERK